MQRAGIAVWLAISSISRNKACFFTESSYAPALAVMVIPGGVTARYFLLENEYERSADLVG